MGKRSKNIETMWEPTTRLSGKRSQREFEELLLKDILMELEVSEEESWEERAMDWTEELDRTPTPEQRAEFERRLDLEVKRLQKQHRQIAQIKAARHQKTMCALRKVAMVAIFITVFLSVTLYNTVDAFATGIDRFITNVMPEEGAKELHVDKDGAEKELNLEDYVGMYVPDWIPQGYHISEVEAFTHLDRVTLVNREGDCIVYEITRTIGSCFVDDEDVESERIPLHDGWGHVVDTEVATAVIWEADGYIYTITGNCDLRDKIIEMANRCIKIEQGD